MLVPALAEVYMDVALVTSSDAHAFDHNASRGRIASLIIYLLTTSQSFRHSLHEFVRSCRAGGGHASPASQGYGSWGAEFVDSVLTDGIFVTKDALGRFADIGVCVCDVCVCVCVCV